MVRIVGLSQSQIGWVTAAIEITGLSSSLLVATIISPMRLRSFFLCGLLWASVSVALFGFSANSKNGTPFFVLCMVTRQVEAPQLVNIISFYTKNTLFAYNFYENV